MSKEMDDHRKRMQEQADAALKAKLDMVEMRNKPAYGRHGRKIGEMICDSGFKSGHRQATVSFVLRLDEKAGEFIAEHGDLWYVSKSRDALKAKMDQVARVTIDLKWTRYLKVEYKAEIPYRDNWNSTTTLDVNEKRGKNPIFGMNLTWEVVEYSDAIHLPGDDGERYMTRDVSDDGVASERQESQKEMPPGLVVYTKEREQLLQGIREAFTTIDKKMCELLGGTPEQVAKRLDSVNGPLLLAAPKKEKR
jgi:hypothetical protein